MDNNKKNLAKTAFAALVLAASLPAAGQAANNGHAEGVLLARGCNAHGCGAASSSCRAQSNGTQFSAGCSSYRTSTCGAAQSSTAPANQRAGMNAYDQGYAPANIPPSGDAMQGRPQSTPSQNYGAPSNNGGQQFYYTSMNTDQPASPKRGVPDASGYKSPAHYNSDDMMMEDSNTPPANQQMQMQRASNNKYWNR